MAPSSCAAARVATGTGRSSGSRNVDAGARPGAPAPRESVPVRWRARRAPWARPRTVTGADARSCRRVHAGSRTDTVSERSDGGVLVGGGHARARARRRWGYGRATSGMVPILRGDRGSPQPLRQPPPKGGEGVSDEHAAVAAFGPLDRRSRRARGVTAAHAGPARPRWRPHWLRRAGRSPVPVPWAAGAP